MSPDAWARRFPTPALLEVVDAFADLVADRVADRFATAEPAGTVTQMGFSPKDAATYLGMAESTVRDHIKSGQIAAARVGSRVVVHRRTLDHLLLEGDGSAVAS